MGRPPKDLIGSSGEELPPEESPLDQIESFFSDLSPGYRIQVWRVTPREFRGLLEEFEVSDSGDPIDLNYLIRTWGGRELKLKVKDPRGRFVKTVTIPMFSHPPLNRGQAPIAQVELSAPATPAPPAMHAPAMPAPAMPAPMFMPQVQPSIADNFTELLGVLQKFRSSDAEVLQSLINRSLSGNQAPVAPQPNPMAQLSQAIELVAKIQAMMGNAAPVAPRAADGDDIFPQITKLAELLLTRRDAPPQLTTPANVRPLIQPTRPAATPQRIAAPRPMALSGEEDIATAIADAPPEALAALMAEAMKKMPSEKRQTLIDAFEGTFAEIEPEFFDSYDDDEEESEKPTAT